MDRTATNALYCRYEPQEVIFTLCSNVLLKNYLIIIMEVQFLVFSLNLGDLTI